MLAWLEQPARVAAAQSAFVEVHEQLRRGGADLAAETVMEVIARGGGGLSSPDAAP
jgi:hypothetical protein